MDIRTLTSDEVAEVLGCDAQRINALAAARKLPAIKYGRSWRFPVDALHQHLHQEAIAHLSERESASPPSPAPPTRLRKPLPDLAKAVRMA